MQIEGKNSCVEFVKSGRPYEKIFLDINSKDEKLVNFFQGKKNVERKDKAFLDRIAKTERHQGIILRAKDFEYYDFDRLLEDIRNEEGNSLIMILDNIEDPHNLGSIVRTAECVGVKGVIIGKNRSAQVNETVLKTSAGAISHMNICRVANVNDAIRKLKADGVFVYGLEADGKSMYETDLTGKTAIVVGSEGFGLNKLTRSLCDGILSINMFGKVNSLNASVASAIAMYEYVRQTIKK